MDKLLDFIERHKYGIVVTIAVHIGLFVYFQIATYKEVVIFEPWEFRSAMDEKPDNIEITPDQIQTPEEQSLFEPKKNVTSFVKDENDTRERSNKRNVNYTSSSQSGDPEQMERDYEQSVKDEIRRKREAREARKESSSTNAKTENQKKTPKKERNYGGGASSEKAVGGETMVSFSLRNRHPLNHNDWYIRNPGYTCGNVNGVVTVAITVDEGGNVTTATVIDAQTKGATPCMLKRAQDYALQSRFNYSAKAPKKQEGTITYQFVYNE